MSERSSARRTRRRPMWNIRRRASFSRYARQGARSAARSEAELRHRLSNALVESTDQKVRLIIRRSFGFHSAEAIIVLAKLNLGGLYPPLPDCS
ncbi:MAG: transposase [Candidatus Dormibacteria bacterium]